MDEHVKHEVVWKDENKFAMFLPFSSFPCIPTIHSHAEIICGHLGVKMAPILISI